MEPDGETTPMTADRKVKTILVAPPHFGIFPTVGVPQLHAFLAAKGHEVKQRLIDTHVYETLLSPEWLGRAFERLREAKDADGIEASIAGYAAASPVLGMFGIAPAAGRSLRQVLAKEHEIVAAVGAAIASFRAEFVTAGIGKVTRNFGLIDLGLRVVSWAHHPTRVDFFTGTGMRYSPFVLADVERAIADRDENPFIAYYEAELYPWLLAQRPGLLGIQVNHENQLIPAVTILAWAREHLAGTFLVVGGTLVSYLREQIAARPGWWRYFDALGTGMGEYTMDGLVRHLQGELPIAEVPNLLYQDKGSGEIRATRCVQMDMDDVVTPIFEGTTRKPILPIFSAAGCYWSRCKFCEYLYHHQNCGDVAGQAGYFARSVDKTIADMRVLQARHDPFFFFFCDSDISPARLGALADRIIAERLDVRYFAWLRAEREFLDPAFCAKLARSGLFGVYMGLEAGDQRINDAMDKGIDVNVVEGVIRTFHQAGIVANVFCMVGTPTETREEAMKTRDFILRNKAYCNDISVSTYQLSTYSIIAQHPERFGIEAIQPADDRLAPVLGYKAHVGMPPEEALALRDEFRALLGADYINGKFIFDIIAKTYPGENNYDTKEITTREKHVLGAKGEFNTNLDARRRAPQAP